MVTLPRGALAQYARVSLYNSPYPAHDAGCAVDLYPGGERAPSPVAGEVVETWTVRCPEKPYAANHDHLVVVDTGRRLARVLHVDPAVDAGDRVEVGDDLGRLVRSGFFAPWVANHLHLGFRERGQNPVRASGSLPVDLGVSVEPVAWDGTGTVVETSETWALLDSPGHPAPGERFAGLASDGGGVLDGGVPHYDGGGVLDTSFSDDATDGRVAGGVSLLGTRVAATPGDAADGRTVAWRDVTVTANDTPIRGLSLWLGFDRLGVKLVAPGHDLAVGDTVGVSVA